MQGSRRRSAKPRISGQRSVPLKRVAVPDVPIPYARPMENEIIPDAADIEESVRAVVSPE